MLIAHVCNFLEKKMPSTKVYTVKYWVDKKEYEIELQGYYTGNYNFRVRFDGTAYYTEVNSDTVEDAFVIGVEKIMNYIPDVVHVLPGDLIPEPSAGQPIKEKILTKTRQLVIHKQERI